MNNPLRRRWLHHTLAAIVALCLLVIAVLFGLPRLLNVPAVSTQLEQHISKLVQGRVTWDTLKLRFLPYPHGVLQGVTIDIPGAVSGRVEGVEAHLRFLPLLLGRADIASIELIRPVLQVRVAASTADTSPTPDPLVAYRSVMKDVASLVHSVAPNASVVIEDGNLDLYIEGMPRIDLGSLSVHGRSDAGSLTVKGSAACNFWNHLQIDARIELPDLRGQAALDVSDLKPQALLTRAVPQPFVVALPSANLHAEARTDGRTAIDVTFSGDIPSLQVARGERHLELAATSFKGNALLTPQLSEVRLIGIRPGELVPVGEVTLRVARGAAASELDIRVPALELSKLRDAALAIAGDEALVREYARRVNGGVVTDLRFGAKANTLDELFVLQNMTSSVTLAQGGLMLPAIEREATEVSGKFELRDGKLRGSGVSARLGGSRVSDGTAEYALATGEASVNSGFDLVLQPTLDIVRGLLSKSDRESIAPIRSLAGRAQGRAGVTWKGGRWGATIAVAQSDSVLKADWLPWPMSVKAGEVELFAGGLKLNGVRGSVGGSAVSEAAAEFSYAESFRIVSASGKATPVLAEIYPWLRSREGLAKALEHVKSLTGSADVVVERLAGKPQEPATLTYEGTVQPGEIHVDISDLPAPVSVAGGSIRITQSAITLAGVTSTLLDTEVKASGKLSDYTSKRLKVDGSVAEGKLGAKFVEWLWRRGQLPQGLEPKAPIRFALQRAQWSLAGSLDTQLTAQFEAGPRLTIDLASGPDAVDLRRLAIKDKRSDVTFSLLAKERKLDLKFAGSMYGGTIDAMLKDPVRHVGHAAGELRVRVDRDHLERSSAEGQLKGENLNLAFLIGEPLTISLLDIEASPAVLHVKEARVNWAGQPATIKGHVTHSGSGPVVDAEIDSPGIVLDALLPAAGPEGEEVAAQSNENFTAWIWRVPAQGKVSLRADFVEYRRFHVAPVRGTVTLEPELMHLEVTEADLCGISFPLVVDATRQGLSASTRISAQDLGIQKTSRCLTGERLLLSGHYDLQADLKTNGNTESDLLRNVKGPVKLEARNGKVMKFALLGNILKMKNISNLLKKGGPKLDDKGFPYKKLVVEGHLENGRFFVDQSAFDSDALGLVAIGSVGIADRDSKLSVLVAPFGTLDRIVRSIPLIGYIVGGTFTSVPVSVSGDIRDPSVVPLGARAVGSELIGILQRTLKLPGKIIEASGTDTAPK
jgi:hypothetical protein